MRRMEYAFIQNPNASQTVDFQPDYTNDPQLTLTCVSFVPKHIAQAIQKTIIEPLLAIEPDFYYFPNESLHVTIQNIRVINHPPHFGPSEVEKAKLLLSEQVHNYGPFTFEYHGLLSMPTSVSMIALVTPEYDQFVKLLRAKLIDAGLPDDKKYFTDEIVFANTTICRYTHKPSQEFIKKIETMKDIRIGNFVADETSLIETNAGGHPSKTRIFGTYRFSQI